MIEITSKSARFLKSAIPLVRLVVQRIVEQTFASPCEVWFRAIVTS